MLDHLVGGERPAELPSYPGILERGVEQGLHDADGFRAERRHGAVDRLFDGCERVAAVAKQGVGAEMNVLQFKMAAAAAAEPVEILQRNARRIRLHKEP